MLAPSYNLEAPRYLFEAPLVLDLSVNRGKYFAFMLTWSGISQEGIRLAWDNACALRGRHSQPPIFRLIFF